MAGGRGPTRHYQLTLDGTAQQLQEAIANKSDGSFDITVADSFDGNPLCEWIDVQADDGNGNPIYGGGDNALTAASYGWRIPAPTAGEPDPPYRIDGPVTMASVWAFGTSSEVLNIWAKVP